MNPVVVFDIDGTIANNNHRKHYVEQRPKNWQAYNTWMGEDSLYHDIADLLVTLSNNANHVILCTGREEVYREATWRWLRSKGLSTYVTAMYMRLAKDYRSDAIVKVELLKEITADYSRPWLWFDDRQQVVDAIRAEGIRVLQVQPGDF